jgi:hypothetical protein
VPNARSLRLHSRLTPGLPRYRDRMSRQILLRALASNGPVAMAPPAMVFLTRQSPAGYTRGASLNSHTAAAQRVTAC